LPAQPTINDHDRGRGSCQGSGTDCLYLLERHLQHRPSLKGNRRSDLSVNWFRFSTVDVASPEKSWILVISEGRDTPHIWYIFG
jgi:hypothetical protein